MTTEQLIHELTALGVSCCRSGNPATVEISVPVRDSTGLSDQWVVGPVSTALKTLEEGSK